MLGNFIYSNPTKLYFGEEVIKNLSEELKNYGPRVLLTYGGGSIKRNGIYDDVMTALKATGKEVIELPGVMPNPTAQKLREGAKIARENDVDLIGRERVGLVRRGPLGEILPSSGGTIVQDNSRGLGSHYGGNRQ